MSEKERERMLKVEFVRKKNWFDVPFGNQGGYQG